MKKCFLVLLILILSFTLTGCGNSKESESKPSNNTTNKIDTEVAYNKYYEYINNRYENYVWWKTLKVYEDHSKYLSDFLDKYFVCFQDINSDNIDELLLFEYEPSPETERNIFSMENGSTTYNDYTKYTITILTYSNSSNESYKNVSNIKRLGTVYSNEPVKKDSNLLNRFSFHKESLSLFHNITLLDAMDNYFQRSNKGKIMTRDYVETLSKEWSIYNNFYEAIKINDDQTQLYLSGDNKYAKVIDKELIEINKNEYDSIINSLIKINFENIDRAKINTNIEYPKVD